MIAQRLAELQANASQWKAPVRERPVTPSGILTQRRNALLERQAFTQRAYERTSISRNSSLCSSPFFEKNPVSPTMASKQQPSEQEISDSNAPVQRTILEERINRLSESTEHWKSRIRSDPDLENLEVLGRLRKDRKISPNAKKTPAVDICKGLDRFYTSPASISPPSKIFQISIGDFDDITSSSPRLVVPARPTARGRCRSHASRRLPEFSAPECTSVPVTPINYRLKQDESSDDDGDGIASSAKKGLRSKLDYSAVKLKKVAVKSPYPNLMLIRIKGEKFADVRLVAPKISSVHAYGVFVLVTPTQLFVYNGKYSNLVERTKAMLVASSVCSKNGELGCHAKRPVIVNEGHDLDFWRLLGSEDFISREEFVPSQLLESENAFENLIAQSNVVFKVNDDYSMSALISSEIPKFSLLNPNENLVFDFGSEIYVWVGRNADRNGTQYAVAYAEKLASQCSLHLKNSQLFFGDDFSEGRPSWCITVKLAQGLGDCLFRHKFPDWKYTVVRPLGKWEQRDKRATALNPIQIESMANELGRCLAESQPTQSVLIFEETEIPRNAKNVFTEGISYYVLEGEDRLTELKELNIFFSDSCYVIKWEYRIERTGIRKLDGTERERDTGRRRIAFFFWLGSATTKKEQGMCALALRNFDRERHPHERIMQGQEPAVFLQLFNGQMIVAGTGSGVFLVFGSSSPREHRMEELCQPVVLRSHATYVIVTDKVTAWYGSLSQQHFRDATLLLAEKLLSLKHERLKKVTECTSVCEMCEGDSTLGFPVFCAQNWIKSPRLIRLYETDGSDVQCMQWDPQAPFSFRQEDLRDTAIVDQGNGLWLWTETVASTYALRVAQSYWHNRTGFARVISKCREPNEFKALFPQWDDFEDEVDENEANSDGPKRWDPCDLNELLEFRTQSWPLEKVIARELPQGVDMKRLEQHLSDDDFESVFQMDRCTFYGLPEWKQVELRKKHRLF